MRTTRALLGFIGCLMMSSGTQASDIYRCVHDGVLVFADQPCGDDAELHLTTHSISVIAASDSLDQIMQQNQRYIEQRGLRQAARRADRLEQQRIEQSAPSRPPVVEYVPIYIPVRRDQTDVMPPTSPRVEHRRGSERGSARARVLSLSDRPAGRARRDEP